MIHPSTEADPARLPFFKTRITQGLSSYLNPNPRTPITLNGSIATSLYTHAQIHTKEQRVWKTEGESERVSIHTVDSATWSKATGREGETRALKMVLQLILWVLAVTLSKYTHTHACLVLSYLTKGRARRVSHSNRGTRLSLVWGAEALFPLGGVAPSTWRGVGGEWRESERGTRLRSSFSQTPFQNMVL